MNKSKQIRKYEVYNKAIITRLKEKYGFTGVFIYASLRGARTSEMSIRICEDYRKMEQEVNNAIKNL